VVPGRGDGCIPATPMLDLVVSAPDLLWWSSSAMELPLGQCGGTRRLWFDADASRGHCAAWLIRCRLGRGWDDGGLGDLGLLMILALFSPSFAFLITRAGSMAELAGFACC
jgi:hypothetical protein